MALGRMCDSYEEMSRMAYRAADKKKQQYWPTTTVCGNYNRKGLSDRSGDGLATAVSRCATPTARDWKSGKASDATMERNSRPLSEQIGGSLNPTWVEWLMGWPLGWTDLKPLATDRSRSALQRHGDFYEADPCSTA
jgi:DNA (cytosine-5)-methyltransferase 1